MRAKWVLGAAPGALALLVVGAALFRARGEPRTVEADRPAAPAPAAEGPGPSAAEPAALVLRAVGLCREARAERGPRAESLRSEAEEAGRALAARLRESPRLWRPVVDLLAGPGDLVAALRVVEMIREAVDADAERLFLDLLALGESPRVRRIAVAALAERPSNEALAAAAAGDPDAGVRMAAIEALGARRGKEDSEEAARRAEETIRRQGREDPDPALRVFASGLLRPPPPPRKAPLGRFRPHP